MKDQLAVEWAKYGIRSMHCPGPFRRKSLERLLQVLVEKFDRGKKSTCRQIGEHQELANMQRT